MTDKSFNDAVSLLYFYGNCDRTLVEGLERVCDMPTARYAIELYFI
ncbi:hypothetical protein IQ264_22760 [Phormidium sp. LEGE 05292]|nr:hypothetical protein [Phormidium sp. LEGE 05292]MBE9228248.1 hypothetical protein [Phormidium sp. LEGE 05292]